MTADFLPWAALTHSNALKLYLKVRLHYGDYRSKLARFKEQKNIFLFFEMC
jgi:hypothetical protein